MKVLVCLLVSLHLVLAGCSDTRGPKDRTLFDAVRNNDAAYLKAYLDAEGDPDSLDENGRSLLYTATGPKGGLEVVSLLLSSGANPNLPNKGGRTSLMNAVGWCSVEITKKLLNFGADPDLMVKKKNARDVVCVAPEIERDKILALLPEKN